MPSQIACRPEFSRGRFHPEPESSTRTPFQRDRDRIIHSVAFRKLKHKTQVFVFHEGDHYRTRLTHSIEVSQIARSISRVLGLDEDLAEAVALAHDLGHTPFGHAGEDALHLCMREYGGFSHNDQTLRILTRLEARYAGFDGLNLTWETVEGVVKHNGPIPIGKGDGGRPAPTLVELLQDWDLEVASWPSAEAQVAALADDIAYMNHDLDDGLRAGLFDIDDLEPLSLIGEVLGAVRSLYPGLERRRLIHETTRRLIDRMVTDLIAESSRRIEALGLKRPDDVRRAGQAIIAFSDDMRSSEKPIRKFLFDRMYRHYQVNRETSKARRVVRDLFRIFMDEPGTLPTEWRTAAESASEDDRARIVADYIAGMTDRYALVEHQRLFAISPHP